jgi:hypothetical protein
VPPADAIEAFAKAHGLTFAARGSLPKQGATLERDTGVVGGAASGKLPGGIEGTLAHYTYTYTTTDSDNHTETHHRYYTVVVTTIPESIGFVPSLGFRGSGSSLAGLGSGLTDMRQLELGDDQQLKDARAYVYKGTSENWITQLFSPALIDWLARSPDDFGFELSNGVFCAAYEEYKTTAEALETLCNDAAHVAGAIREESLEETATGGADADAAKDPNANDPKMEAALAAVQTGSPASLGAATGSFASHLRSSPSTFFWALWKAVLITLVLNVPGAAIPILLIVAGNYAVLAAIEGALVLILLFFIYRKRVRVNSAKYANEAFFRAYAKDRELTLEEPLHFSATHAEAKLPFKPDRVFTGMLTGGVNGSLVLIGDGSKRSDRIAVVGGPKGPVAESELEAEPQGLSAKDLDTYLEQLSGEVKEAEGKPAAPAAG